MMPINELKYDLNQEILKSEIKRVKLFILFLSIGLGIALLNIAFFKYTVDYIFLSSHSYNYLLIWFLAFIGYEVIILKIYQKKSKEGKPVSNFFKLTNVLDEITFPTILLIVVLMAEQKEVLLDSPIVFAYFIIIVVSALHLDFRLSFLTGIVAALEHTGLVIWVLFAMEGQQQFDVLLPESIYFVRSIFFVISGACAGFVANELKKRIIYSFRHLYEKKQIQLLFGQQVSPEVVHALIREDRFSRRREVTIMFLDIRNFSSYAELRDPEEVIEFQNNIFSPLMDIINEHKGIVNQILGDGFMATFGAPIDNPEHCESALKAGIKILAKMKELEEQQLIPPTKIGIGLHTGEVITGNIGSDHRKQYSVSGSAVIIASRIEQLNKKYNSQFLVSCDIIHKINQENINLQSLGFERLRGLGEDIEIFKIA